MKLVLVSAAGALLALGAWFAFTRAPVEPLDQADFEAVYAEPLAAPTRPLRVYHLGHSLVGRDMPAMLAQLAGEGHGYESQLGWGTPLEAHWGPPEAIAGFEGENAHARFRPVREALASGEYDALVLTEMVELRDAIRYHDSAEHLARWARLAREAPRAGAPAVRVYLYESWHRLDDAEGWLERLERDYALLWEGELLRGALARDPQRRPIWVIPAGQVMAAVVRAAESGEIEGLERREQLFAREASGAQDPIHLSDLGCYLVALAHYAVLYQRNPEGLAHELRRADGTPATAPGLQAARAMQRLAWQVVQRIPQTGIAR
jgi:hypothetical protein